jgi:GntR family transcriptional regulator/MocR family aminotransferase
MPGTRTSSIPELLLTIDRDGPVALHRQLERALQDAIRSGRLRPNAPLPSTRALAAELTVSRGVVVEAYEQLAAEGYLESRPGAKTRVALRADAGSSYSRDGHRRARYRNGVRIRAYEPSRETTGPEPRGPEPPGEEVVLPSFAMSRARHDFSYGRPDVSAFPRGAWLRSLKRVLNEAPADRLSYIDGRGAIELREALAGYLNRVRGTSATPGHIVITNGFAQGQRLVLQVIRDLRRQGSGPRGTRRGPVRVAMEDPGQIDTWRAAELLGLELVPIPVDDDGIIVERLANVDAAVCVVTPAHEFPTGAVMSPERRAALVRWARDRDAFVLEDDYDAEYRYDREPIGAIQGLAPDRVIYGGSASKTLAPGLRLSWLILPAPLVEPFATAKFAGDRGSASLEQLAFADFLSRGEFDRHLRRMRPIYRARRDALLRALAKHLPTVTPVGASAGLHVLALLPPGVDEAAVLARADELDIAVDGLSQYRLAADVPAGLILGYAQHTENQIDARVERLAEAIAVSR